MGKTKKSVAADAPEALQASVTDEVLAQTPERALKLLRGIASRPRVMAALASRGYSREEHARGWELLTPLVALPSTGPSGPTPQLAAMAELDQWDEPNLPVLRACLGGALAPVRGYLLGDINAATGPAAVVNIKKLVDRVRALATLPAEVKDAGVTRDLAAAASSKLARRGYPEAEWARLEGLVQLAQSTPDTDAYENVEDDTARHNQLVLLREWYEEIASLAKVVLKRRDDLIAVGLATRQTRTPPEPETPSTPPATPGPTNA